MTENTEILVVVKNVSKKFSLNLRTSMMYGLKDLGKTMLGIPYDSSQLREKEFWAVKDISFQLRRGECLGLIGRNGAGKSTLLKLLNGLIRPDEGSITMHGKVGALIELGAGFNPLLSGRENVYNNGQLLGFSRKEVEERFNAILEFAEIGKFIDSPVQNYSSGMKVRLGFAIAAQMEPDILLIDEVLAVGDMGFVLKCFNKMDVLRSKTAMIFVTHGLSQVSRMCTDICIMNEGKSAYQSSNVAAGITRYYEMFKTQIVSFKASDKVSIKKITLSSEGKESTDEKTLTVEHGAELCLSLELNCIKSVYNPRITLIFYDKEQKNIAETLNFEEQIELAEFEGLLSVKAVLPRAIFSQGNYSITIALSELENGARKIVFRQQSAIYFNVHSKVHGWAPFQLDVNWQLVSGNLNTP